MIVLRRRRENLTTFVFDLIFECWRVFSALIASWLSRLQENAERKWRARSFFHLAYFYLKRFCCIRKFISDTQRPRHKWKSCARCIRKIRTSLGIRWGLVLGLCHMKIRITTRLHPKQLRKFSREEKADHRDMRSEKSLALIPTIWKQSCKPSGQ